MLFISINNGADEAHIVTKKMERQKAEQRFTEENLTLSFYKNDDPMITTFTAERLLEILDDYKKTIDQPFKEQISFIIPNNTEFFFTNVRTVLGWSICKFRVDFENLIILNIQHLAIKLGLTYNYSLQNFNPSTQIETKKCNENLSKLFQECCKNIIFYRVKPKLTNLHLENEESFFLNQQLNSSNEVTIKEIVFAVLTEKSPMATKNKKRERTTFIAIENSENKYSCVEATKTDVRINMN